MPTGMVRVGKVRQSGTALPWEPGGESGPLSWGMGSEGSIVIHKAFSTGQNTTTLQTSCVLSDLAPSPIP